jgi:hypothetical protein
LSRHDLQISKLKFTRCFRPYSTISNQSRGFFGYNKADFQVQGYYQLIGARRPAAIISDAPPPIPGNLRSPSPCHFTQRSLERTTANIYLERNSSTSSPCFDIPSHLMAQSWSSKIPALLQPVVHALQDDSLHLLTEVTGSSTTWLATRYIAEYLGDRPPPSAQHDRPAAKTSKPRAVLFTSFLRPVEFWKQDTKRACVCVSLINLERYWLMM